jgi:hypothetical protein
VTLQTTTFQLSWLIIAFSEVPDISVTLNRSMYILCLDVVAFSATLSFQTFFCLALDFPHCLHTCTVPCVRTRPSSQVIFYIESLFLSPSMQWTVLILTLMPMAVLADATSVKCINLHANTAPFLVGTTIQKLITPPLPFSMQIVTHPHV